MTVSELIYQYKSHNPHGHYFDRDTLKFFGERQSEMHVAKDIVVVKDAGGMIHKAYCLSSRQRNYPGGPRRKYTYFDVETFQDIIL